MKADSTVYDGPVLGLAGVAGAAVAALVGVLALRLVRSRRRT
jgi:hypothetical protein